MWKDDIEFEKLRLREAGIIGPYKIVPTIFKRCFMPCALGCCNCLAKIDNRFSVVTEDCFDSCIRDFLREIDYLSNYINKDSE